MQPVEAEHAASAGKGRRGSLRANTSRSRACARGAAGGGGASLKLVRTWASQQRSAPRAASADRYHYVTCTLGL